MNLQSVLRPHRLKNHPQSDYLYLKTRHRQPLYTDYQYQVFFHKTDFYQLMTDFYQLMQQDGKLS
ncbi:hypothetical protein Nizo2484_2348 [Lactiplantibacillus plantarum]|nr:hypothetical protein Nizo2484_2348 [Lactiplantibacillus plantarum]